VDVGSGPRFGLLNSVTSAETFTAATAVELASTPPVARKKAPSDLKRYGTLIRVSDEFAEAIRDAASFEKLSVAEFATKHLLDRVRKRYREAVLKEAKRVEGQGN
jgi:hypothetical protein